MIGLEAAYRGRCKMLSSIFGGEDQKPQDPSTISFAAQFDAMAKVFKANKKK